MVNPILPEVFIYLERSQRPEELQLGGGTPPQGNEAPTPPAKYNPPSSTVSDPPVQSGDETPTPPPVNEPTSPKGDGPGVVPGDEGGSGTGKDVPEGADTPQVTDAPEGQSRPDDVDDAEVGTGKGDEDTDVAPDALRDGGDEAGGEAKPDEQADVPPAEGGAGDRDGGSNSHVDPNRAVREPDTGFEFAPDTDHQNAVDARDQAVAGLDAAAAARDAVLADLADAGYHVDAKNLTVNKIDPTVASLERQISLDPTLSVSDKLRLLDLVDQLGEASWGERGALTARNDASEALGDTTAEVVASQKGEVEIINGAGAPRGRFDYVSLSEDGSQLIFTKAKGGDANLSSSGRKVDGVSVPQGSTNYFNSIFKNDPALRDWLAANPDAVAGIRDGSIEVSYRLVRARPDGSVEVYDLLLNKDALDLGL